MGVMMCLPKRRDSYTVTYFGIPVSTLVVCEQQAVQQSTNYVPDVPILLQDVAFHWDSHSEVGIAGGGGGATISPDSMWIAAVEKAINDFVRKSRILSIGTRLQGQKKNATRRSKPAGRRAARVFDKIFHSLVGKTPLRAPHFIALLTLFLRKLPEPLLPPLFVRQVEDILRNSDMTEASKARAFQKASRQSFILTYPSDYLTFQYLKQLIQRHRAELIAAEVETLVSSMLRSSSEHVVRFMIQQLRPFVNLVMPSTSREERITADGTSVSGSRPYIVVPDADSDAQILTGSPSLISPSDHIDSEAGGASGVATEIADVPLGNSSIDSTTSISSSATARDDGNEAHRKGRREKNRVVKQDDATVNREPGGGDAHHSRQKIQDVNSTDSFGSSKMTEHEEEEGSEEKEEIKSTECELHRTEIACHERSVGPVNASQNHDDETLEEEEGGRVMCAKETQTVLQIGVTIGDQAYITATPEVFSLTDERRQDLLPGDKCQVAFTDAPAVAGDEDVCVLAPYAALRSVGETDQDIILLENCSPFHSVTDKNTFTQKIDATPLGDEGVQERFLPECLGQRKMSFNVVGMPAAAPSGTLRNSASLPSRADANIQDNGEVKTFVEKHPRYAALMGAKKLFLGKERLPPRRLFVENDPPAFVAAEKVNKWPGGSDTEMRLAEKSQEADKSFCGGADESLFTEKVRRTVTSGEGGGDRPQSVFNESSPPHGESWNRATIQPLLAQILELTARCESLVRMVVEGKVTMVPPPSPSCQSRQAVTRVEEEVVHLKDAVHEVAESQSKTLDSIVQLKQEIQQQHKRLENVGFEKQNWQDDTLEAKTTALEIRRRCADLEATQLQEHRLCEHLSLKMKDLGHKLECFEKENVHLKVEISTLQQQSLLLRDKLMSV